MTDRPIPPWEFEARCPQCGSKLFVKRELESGPVELEPNERLFCSIHGDTMSIEEARRIAFEENRDDAINKARKIALESFRRKLTK